MAFEDLKEYGTEAAVKAAGKQRQQGKTCKYTSKSLVMMTLMYRRGSRWRYLLLEVWSVDGRVGSYIVCKHCILLISIHLLHLTMSGEPLFTRQVDRGKPTTPL